MDAREALDTVAEKLAPVAARLSRFDELRGALEAAQLGDVLDLAATAAVWVEAKRGWLLDDPDRRADPEDLALIDALDAAGLYETVGEP